MAYIGNDLRSNEDYKIIDDISSGFNGSATSFALQVGGATPVPFPKFEQQLLISVNGVIQEPDPTGSAGFKLSGTNIVFSSAPTNGHAFFGVIYAGADYVNAGGTFPDGSINFPSITFSADTNTGFTRTASGTVALISDGTKVAQFPTGQGSSGQALITDGGGNLSFGIPTNIVNANINASAAIAGTKISPDFGSQAISTTGNVTIGESIIHSGDTDTKMRFDTPDRLKIETAGVERVAFGGVTTFNDSGADCNFRIEGDTDENLFFLDAGNNRVGIGTNNPNGKFVVASETSRTNDVEHLLIMTHTSSGTTTTGFGTGIRFQGERHNGNLQTIGDINYEADVNSGGNISAALVFKPSTNGSPTEKLRLTSDGKLGIGTSSPDQTLHVHKGSAGSISSTANSVLTLENSNDSILQFLSPSSNVNQIRFGDPADNGAGYIDYNHGNNALTFGTNGPEKMRLDSNGRLGIGETAPLAQLHIKPPSNMSQLLLEQNNAVDGYALFQDGPNGGHLKFMRHVNGSETQTLLLRAGGGLCFGTDNAQANALNDYEEGTFTGGFNDFNGTYTANTGTYTKIGNVVTIQIMVSGNGGSGSGALILTSLPFASEGTPSTYRAVGAIHAHTGLVTGGIQIVGLMNNNENKVRIRTVQNNATTTDLNRNGLNSGGFEVVIGIVYHTAS